MTRSYIVAITGASGAVYATRLLQVLLATDCRVDLSISPSGQAVIGEELGRRVDLENFSPESLLGEEPPTDRLRYHHHKDMLAPMASGSHLTDGMVICPCSGGTLSAIAHASSTNLIHRAADVHLKERRKLILVPRETPLSTIQLENMQRCAAAGAIVLPAMPGFYHQPLSISDLVDFVVARICDQLGNSASTHASLGRNAARIIAATKGWPIMLDRLRHILEMIRFSHTVFALPFALLAAVMAWWQVDAGEPLVSWPRALAGIVLCMVFARSASMAFNRLADHRLDANNPRTRTRHIPAGLLSARSVGLFAAACAALFVASTLFFWPNRWPLYLSGPLLLFLGGYSYTKRFTSLAHFWLGAALMLAPISAWIALRGEIAWPPVLLGGAVLLWVAGFDMIYACLDVEFDRQARLHSVPARIGVVGALRLAAVCHVGMAGLLLALPVVYPQLGAIYLTGIGVVACLLAYEHWLVRPDDLTRVNVAFFQVNAIVSIGLFVLGTIDLLVR